MLSNPFAGAYDAQGGYFLPSEYMRVSDEISRRYPNLNLVWIPPEDRNADDTHPFAIYDTQSKSIVKRMKESEMYLDSIFRWLDENDGSKHDLFAQFMEDNRIAEEAKAAKEKEERYELADVIHTIANSEKHTFRHNGRKLGVDNDRPSLLPRDLTEG